MRKYFFIALILMLAIFLRFFSISTNPPSLTWDEAAWGYNAYSLGTDGRDEFGKFLPLTYIESFGDYKPPLYAYLAVIPVRIFGLNEFATRFPSAFFGVLTVLITYFLTKRIFNVSSKLEIGNWKLEILPLLAAGLLAISPWHILLSRAAFEANVATFFIVLGVFLFFSSLSNKWLLPLSVISFIISMYTFNTARILAPLLLLVLLISQRKYLLFALKKQLFVSLILGAVFFLPLFLFLLTPQAKLRFQEVNIFTDSQVVDRANQQIANDNNAFWSKIIHNRRLGFAASFLNHYFDNFSPEFLFIKGDGNPKFSIRDVGQMYIWEIPFFIAGILLLFRKREGYWWIIPIWLILGIIPAATARETPHALRIEAVLPTFQILTAYGLYHLISNFKLRPILSGLVSIVAIFNFLYFYHNYFVHYPREFSSEWQYGYKEAIGFVKNNEAKYDKVILTEDLGRPYIYALFYTKYDPSGFRKEARIEREVYGKYFIWILPAKFQAMQIFLKSLNFWTETKFWLHMNKLFLLTIIVVAILIRFWQIGNVPPSPDWDEASLGYNAYSIMLTGKDEYGKFLPIILRSFDDYKPALYAYLIIPFIKIFGLNIVAVRLPAAIFGVLGVLGTYFLVKELFNKNSKRLEILPLLAAGLLAISPWHVQFSRVAFETQVGLAFNIFSILFFLKGFKQGAYLFISAFFAALSIYVYQSEKVYIPILFFVFALIYWKDILAIPKKWLISALLFGAIFVFPMFWTLVSDPNSLMRARGVSVFSDQTQFLKKNVQKLEQDRKNNDYLGLILDNRRVEYSKSIISGYISHWNLNWLFITGDIERHHAPFMGLMYLVELPFLLAGIYFLLFGNYPKKTKLTILALFLIAPIPASVTSGVPHAVRTINFLPTFQIFTAIGALAAASFISNIKYKIVNINIKYLIFALCILFFIFNILYYLNQYFVQQNYYYSQAWQYGYKQAIDFIAPIKGRYQKIVVSNVSPLDQSYMFFLYYLKFNPASYQKLGGTLSGGFAQDHKGFDKFTFKEIVWDSEKKEKTLFVGTMDDFGDGAKILKKINYLDGKSAIVIAEVQ